MRSRVITGITVLVAAAFFTACSSADDDTSSERPTSSTKAPAPDDTPLRASADGKRFLVGVAVAADPLRDELAYRRAVAREYNAVTPENAMKWDTIHPEEDRYDFGPADSIVRFAREHDMAVRGHTLVWYRQVPEWVTERSWTRPELERVLHDHIRKVVGRYRGKVTQWDVVNEAVDDQGKMRDSVWMRVIGPDYIDLAFTWAHQADPEAKLFYNDYELEYPGAKANAVHALVRGLQDRKVPIDGVGFQGHQLTVRKPTRTDFEAALRTYADEGLDVAITELDVGIFLPANPADLEEQAVIYEGALGACLAVSRCNAFVTWGFTDKHSWIPGELPGFGDALPFDESYRPKPAALALRTELAQAGG